MAKIKKTHIPTSRMAVILWRREKNKMENTPQSRMAILKKWADVIVKPCCGKGKNKKDDTRSLSERREAFERMGKITGREGNCWVCRQKELLFNHHVVQLQNGGSNWHLNIVRICDGCHCEIHPWMTPKVFTPINLTEVVGEFSARD